MAWPFTALTTYVANSLPAIKAADLNSLQAYIGHLFSGTKTVKKLEADGTGDATPAAASGEVCGKRLRARGTALAAGDFSTTGFGASPTIGSVSGTDSHCQVSVTADGDAGGAGATVKLTFKDGAWASAPWAIAIIEDTANNATWTYLDVTTTVNDVTLTLKDGATHVSAQYKFKIIVIG